MTPDGGLTAKICRGDEDAGEPAAELLAGREGRRRFRRPRHTGGDPQTSANMRNWMECVRSRKTPNASIEAGYSHSMALCMNVAAIQTGQKVTFNDKTQQVMVGGKVYA